MTATRVRAPASTANIGPGFDCAAAALDLWNELEVTEGGEANLDHLGVRAFAIAVVGLVTDYNDVLHLQKFAAGALQHLAFGFLRDQRLVAPTR